MPRSRHESHRGRYEPPLPQGFAFGCYNAAFGVAWFTGSVAMGLLYDLSLPAMIAFSMGLQFAAIPLLVLVTRGQMLTKHVVRRDQAIQT